MRSTLTVRAAIVLVVGVLLGGTLLAAPATSATPERASTQVSSRAPGCVPRCWVAVSFNTDTWRGGWTKAGNWGSKAGAMSSALNHCKVRPVNAGHRRACQRPAARKAYAQNGCVAVAKLVRNDRLIQWAVAKAYGPLKAKRLAKRKLEGRGNRTAGYACSPRRF